MSEPGEAHRGSRRAYWGKSLKHFMEAQKALIAEGKLARPR